MLDRLRPVLGRMDTFGGSMTPALTEALLGAVAPLHEAPHDADAWQRALGVLARAIPCGHAMLVERVGPVANADLGFVAGTNNDFLDGYQREFHRIDPFASEEVVARLQDLGHVAHSNYVLRDVDLLRSAFYQQFLSRHGDLFHGLGGSFAISEQAHAHLWLLRPRGQGFDDDERWRLDVFFSHARAALRQRCGLAQMKRERDAALAWMDCWGDPSYVLDAHGHLLVANLIGERLLRNGELLSLRQGRLRAGRSSEVDWLLPALTALMQQRRRRNGDGARCIALPRPGLRPLYAVLTVLPNTHGPGSDDGPRVALTLRDPQQARPQPDADQLRDLFAFTAAEARVANALLSGQSVEDIARDAQVRRDTVRAHVKRMLAKTGTHRQSDLLQLLVKTLPNLRSLLPRAGGVEDDGAEA